MVLKLADPVMADIQLEQAITEQGMFDSRAEFPRALRLQIGVAAGDPIDR